ncbi:MAG TPA: NAD(P)-dependent oxidoreductase [Terriglobales bacterium]|jgi:phosphoglycerate dehydrogenase-like enzyme
MRPRILISAGQDLFASFFAPGLRTRLSHSFSCVLVESNKLNSEFKRELAVADGLITTWDSPHFDQDLPRNAPKLRIIAHCGGEVKRKFASQLFEKLTITNAAGPMARATAELGAAFVMYCGRDVDRYREALRKRSNRVYADAHIHGTAESIYGTEVAMIGFGRVGRALVDLMRGFNLRWNVYDPFAPRALARNYPVTFSELRPLLRQAHVLVLTAALTDRTRGLLDRKALSLLPDGATVINIARGGLIDLAALTSEVRRGRLRCALDVTDPTEPLPVAHPLRTMSGAIVTPHIAGGGREVRGRMAEVVITDLEKFFQKKAVENRVTKAMLQRMT